MNLRIIVAVTGLILLTLMTCANGFGQSVQLSIPDSSGAVNTEISIPLNISSTTGKDIIAADITVQYDSNALSATGVDVLGTIASDWIIFANLEEGQIVISMAGMSALSGSGALANMNFLVKSTASVGTTSQVSFTEAAIWAQNIGKIDSTTSNGTFKVDGVAPVRMPGDANGDDQVNHLDVLKLILSYGKSSGMAGYDANADFNGDGRVNRDDALIIWANFGATN